jgi:hypothetical protein
MATIIPTLGDPKEMQKDEKLSEIKEGKTPITKKKSNKTNGIYRKKYINDYSDRSYSRNRR